jgi:hypothetical protein
MPRSGPRILRNPSRLMLLPLISAAGLALVLGLLAMPAPAHATDAASYTAWQSPATLVRATEAVSSYVYLPLVAAADPCRPIPGESYATLRILSDPTNPPAEEHPDINLAIRGYELTSAFLGLVDYGGPTDDKAPQLATLCTGCAPPFRNAYQVYRWDWANDRRGELYTNPEVTLIGMHVTPGQTIHVPDSGYNIGNGYEVLVLYASTERITLKYTREDNVVYGYTVHAEGVCVEPSLLALYEAMNAAGRDQLPALWGGQGFGRARGNEVMVAIRDTGSFMDPRTRKDWWKGW